MNHNPRSGRSIPTPEKTSIVPAPLGRWLITFKDDLLAGRVDLAEIIECTDSDMQEQMPQLCVSCSRSVRVGQPGEMHGLCSICWLYRLADTHKEKLAQLEAQRAVNQGKTAVRRMRDQIDPDRPRGAAPWRECDICGDRLPPLTRHPEPICSACLDRDERRESGASDDDATML